MRKLRFTLNIILIFIVQSVMAIPPMPGVTRVLNGDGTYINVRIYGDDFFHYTITDDGYLIDMPSQGVNKGFYVYAYTDNQGRICLTNDRVGSPLTKASHRQSGMPQYVKDIAQDRIEKMQQRNIEEGLLTKQVDGIRRAPASLSERRGVVLLIEFPDLRFTHTQSEYNNMLNQKGYSANGGAGSAADYFYDNSLGKMSFSFDVIGPILVSKPYAYYGSNNDAGYDNNAAELCAEAVQLASINHGVDFSQYDQDNNGDIDVVFYFFAGHGEAQGASADHIWPHKSVVDPDYNAHGVSNVVNGKKLYTYACASELKGNSGVKMDGIGTFCHEFSHVLGLVDLYDTDRDINGKCVGVGNYSIMDGGSYNLGATTPPYYMAFEREMVGWLDMDDIVIDKKIYQVKSIENIKDNDAVAISGGLANTYYYLEARSKDKWDRGIPNSGVLVYYIDKSNKEVANTGITAKNLWAYNRPNSTPYAPCAMILHANNSTQKGSAKENIQKGWVYPNGDKRDITPATTPSSISRYNVDDYFYVTGIKYNSDGTASFVIGERSMDLSKEFPVVSIKVPQGGFTTSTPLELIDVDQNVTKVVWYINGSPSNNIIKGSNVEIKAVINLKNGTSQTLFKYYNL
ncbi:MAG: M6 family metalloprotease domain-containing protein [Rikenellaceae bacterium]